MRFKIKAARLAALLVPALALAAPAFAQARDPRLSDSQEPGSVIVFPKFIQGTVSVDGVTEPRSELEVGVLCPKGAICPELQQVKIRFHWVCGTTEGNAATSFVCNETDFDVKATVWEKIVLTPDGIQVGPSVPTKIVPRAECARGYLIGWVINPANDQPIKFDGLVGNAVLRETATAYGAYNAIPIQADPALANMAAITLNGNGALFFDGMPGHYQAVTGRVFGDVKYSNFTASPAFPEPTVAFLTLLTLDVKSNRPNNPVFVDFDFFGGNPSQIGNENQLSTRTDFICWEEVFLTNLDVNLVQSFMGRKGVFGSDQATKVGIFGIQDSTGPTTLLGLFESDEGPASNPFARVYYNNLFNDSKPIPTHFLPTPSPNFLLP
jgi:hypothetical protein